VITNADKARVSNDPSGVPETLKDEIVELKNQISALECLQVKGEESLMSLAEQILKQSDDPSSQDNDIYRQRCIRDEIINRDARLQILKLRLNEAEELNSFAMGWGVKNKKPAE